MINKLKQNKLILIIFMISIILIIIGVTYSLYEILFTGRKEQVIDAGGIVFKYNETSDGLILDNNSILDDTAGKTQEKYFDFEISLASNKNTSINYIIAIDENDISTLTNDKVKVYLTNQDNIEIVSPISISQLEVDVNKNNYKKLYNKQINQGEKHLYRLRTWIDDTKDLYTETSNDGNHTLEMKDVIYKFKVNVYTVLDNEETIITGVDTLIALTDNKDNSGLYTITHPADSTLQIGATEDITEYRYRGANPKNYVTFNNEVWRIIGVFPTDDGTGNIENRIKLVSNESKYSWYWDNATTAYNYSKQDNLMLLQDNNKSKVEYLEKDKNYNVIMVAPSVTGYNNWARPASSNTYLNTTYYSSLNDDKNLISNVKYYLGGYNSTSTTSVDMYQYERKINGSTYYNGTNPNSWTGKIGFMYVSDYGYATENCENKMLYSTKSSSDDLRACNDINWLKNVISKSREGIIWTLDQGSHTGSHVYYVKNTGLINLLAVGTEYVESYPVLYLKSDIQITGGSGTSSSPYTLGL